MYREGQKLYPAERKNQAEFHIILEDIDVKTKEGDKFVVCNNAKN